jgi:prevent-host-death family protein
VPQSTGCKLWGNLSQHTHSTWSGNWQHFQPIRFIPNGKSKTLEMAASFAATDEIPDTVQYGQVEMTTMPAASKKTRSAPIASSAKTISVADAKAHFSSLLSGVEQKKMPITILRRGIPIAQIVPIPESQQISGYGWMRGTVQELGDITVPTGIEWIARDE